MAVGAIVQVGCVEFRESWAAGATGIFVAWIRIGGNWRRLGKGRGTHGHIGPSMHQKSAQKASWRYWIEVGRIKVGVSAAFVVVLEIERDARRRSVRAAASPSTLLFNASRPADRYNCNPFRAAECCSSLRVGCSE